MTQSWQGKSKGTTLGYRIFIGILRFAGLRAAYILLLFVSLYYVFFSPSSTKPIYYYFRKRLGYGFWRAVRGIYRNYYLFGQTLLDKTAVMAGLKVPFTFEFECEHYQEEIINGGKGGILISAHLGNYELAGYYFNRLTARVNIIMADNEDERIKQYLESVMTEKNLNIIYIKDDLSHVYEISNALNNNELIAMHADRFMPGNKTITGTLLGEEAQFPIGPFILATTFKVPVSFVYCCKESPTHYHMSTSEPRLYTGDKKQAIQQALKDYTDKLEEKIHQYPEQWFNYFNFWEK